MGYHICISNENAIDISLRYGVYGNVGKAGESRRTIWGKIKDLYAVNVGDLIILYVKQPLLHFRGVFEVTSSPYILSDDLFLDSNQKYPFRFNFRIKYFFPNPVPSHEFYSLIESGKIDSMISLSRDVNSSYRGIRQLFESEFNEILHLFYKYNPKTLPDNFSQITNPKSTIAQIEARDFDINTIDTILNPIQINFNRIPFDGEVTILEDILHAYIVVNVLQNTNDVRDLIGFANFKEIILEAPVFKSMQFRSDILGTFSHKGRIYFYSFIELKQNKTIGIEEISQLIGYLKSFAASKSLPVNSYEGVYISSRFDSELVDYLMKRKTVEKENIISLIEYSIFDNGKVKLNRII